MVYCPKCGKKNQDDAEYCSKCGDKLTATKKDQKTQVKDGSFDKQVEDFAEEVGQIGKKAGKKIEQGMKNFGEEVNDIGKRVSKELEKTGKELESGVERTFGVLWPLIASLIGLVILWLVIVMMKVASDDVPVFTDISNFLQTYLWLFFALILFFSYTGYASRKCQPFRWISPVISAIGFVLVIWIVINIFKILNFFEIQFLRESASIIERILPLVFVLVLVFGYLVFMLTITTKQAIQSCEETKPKTDSKTSETTETTDYRRLYRSGKDRILGGVCGGVAEYFKVDPVIVRIFWIIITFFPPGLGILLYFLFWIIVPRNPSHNWH